MQLYHNRTDHSILESIINSIQILESNDSWRLVLNLDLSIFKTYSGVDEIDHLISELKLDVKVAEYDGANNDENVAKGPTG